jgi:hypothetical protein
MTSNIDQSGKDDVSAGPVGAEHNRTEQGNDRGESLDGETTSSREPKGSKAKRGARRIRERRRGDRGRVTMSLAVMAREYIWLWDVRHGIGINEIAMREGVSSRRVQQGVARARALEKNSQADSAAIRPPRLIPLFPIAPYTPLSTCGHRQPIESDSLLCCMVCHCSGVDDHPGLQRSPLTEPAPERKPDSEVVPKRQKRETRRERRQRLFGTTSVASSA